MSCKYKWAFILVFIFISSWSLEQTRTNKKNKDLKGNSVFIHPPKKVNLGDTIEIDTIVIRYKKKDTSFIVNKYKGKLPILYSNLGGYANLERTNPDTMNMLLDSTIKVHDSTGQEYKVLSFLFGYRQRDDYIEDETMEVKTRYDYYSIFIVQDSLPLIYKKNIKGVIKGSEKFWFEKIIVENKKGEKFIAPNFTISIYEN